MWYRSVVHQPVQKLCATIEIESVLVPHLEEDAEAGGHDLGGVGEHQRRRAVRFPRGRVDRVPVPLDQFRRPGRLIAARHVGPSHRLLDGGFECQHSAEPVGMLERQPQRSHATHRDSAHERQSSLIGTSEAGDSVADQLVEDEGLPLRPSREIEVAATPCGGRHDVHGRQ